MSYDGALDFGLLGDYDAMPDLDAPRRRPRGRDRRAGAGGGRQRRAAQAQRPHPARPGARAARAVAAAPRRGGAASIGSSSPVRRAARQGAGCRRARPRRGGARPGHAHQRTGRAPTTRTRRPAGRTVPRRSRATSRRAIDDQLLHALELGDVVLALRAAHAAGGAARAPGRALRPVRPGARRRRAGRDPRPRPARRARITALAWRQRCAREPDDPARCASSPSSGSARATPRPRGTARRRGTVGHGRPLTRCASRSPRSTPGRRHRRQRAQDPRADRARARRGRRARAVPRAGADRLPARGPAAQGALPRGRARGALDGRRARREGIVALVGFAERADDVYNALAVLADGAVHGDLPQDALPNYGVFDEQRYFQAGDERRGRRPRRTRASA